MHALRAKARSASPKHRALMIGAGFSNDWTFTAGNPTFLRPTINGGVVCCSAAEGAARPMPSYKRSTPPCAPAPCASGLISKTAAVLGAANLGGRSGLIGTCGSGIVPRLLQYKPRVEFAWRDRYSVLRRRTGTPVRPPVRDGPRRFAETYGSVDVRHQFCCHPDGIAGRTGHLPTRSPKAILVRRP